jgi:hypothetical protein
MMVGRRQVWVVLLAVLVGGASAEAAQAAVQADTPRNADRALPQEAFSPAFLGMYRKVMEIDAQIVTYAKKYNVDPSLARAVCMFESGGNGQLRSGAGAQGYFQVMPSTFRLMRVPTNIEAGIKYLSQMTDQFGREDYALAAYNGGPGRVATARPMPLESLQYVIGVGQYRTVLKMYEPAVRAYAAQVRLTRSRAGDDWWTLSRRLGLPVIQLRLYNPFISDLTLSRGTQLIAYPASAMEELVDVADDGSFEYRSRIGDNYINLAFAFDIDLDDLRTANGLWRLQTLPAGMTLRFPQATDGTYSQYEVRAGEGLSDVALRAGVEPWQLIRDNSLWDEEVEPGMVLRVRRPAPPARKVPAVVAASLPARPRQITHRVRRGDTLTELAEQYDTTVSAIQRANGMGRRTTIRLGERLKIPVTR